jgi:hypothetical protein
MKGEVPAHAMNAFVGVVVCWCVGVLVCWCFGVVVCWCVGVLVWWCVGVLVCWCVGAKSALLSAPITFRNRLPITH